MKERRKLLTIIVSSVSIICIFPAIANILGLDFSSKHILLTADHIKLYGVRTDDLFLVLKGELHHALLEWSSVVLAIVTAIIALAHFTSSKDITYPIIGLALLSSGFMDAFHTAASLRLIDAVVDNSKFIPFTWAVSRTFNASILIVGALIILFVTGRNSDKIVSFKKCSKEICIIAIVSIIFIALSYFLIHIFATSKTLPQTQFPDSLISRPYDILPLILFVIAVPFFWTLYKRKPSILTFTIFISLIPEISLESYLAFGSSRLFDSNFNMAHFLKITAYAVPLLGLLLDYVETYRQHKIANNKIEAYISVLQQNQTDIENTKRYFQLVLENAADGIITINSDGKIQSTNKSAELIFGYSEDEFKNMNINTLLPNEHHKKHNGYLNDWKDGKEINIIGMSDRELYVKHKSGKELPIEIAVTEVKNEGENFFTAFVKDITERKKTADALKEARVKAESANLAKSIFLANMSHEIRTPMNGILGTVSLLASTNLNKDQRKKVNLINSSGESLLDIINEILDFSKIEAGEMVLENAPSDLHDSVNDIVDLLYPRANSKNIELCYFYGENVPRYLVCDAGRIRQIILNMVGNAIKFTEKGKISIRITCEDKISDDLKLRFEVIDTGIGISKEKQKLIFNQFMQTDVSSIRKTAGTGLGLSICKSLVEMMGGEIGIDSTEGKGSTFWFVLTLPIADKKFKSDRINYSNEQDNNLYDANVLVVDDIIANQYVAVGMLEQLGCKVDIAANGKEAVEATKLRKYDIVFMDCHMPVMDGYEATKQIRENEKDGEHINIIAITANAMVDDKAKCISYGMDDYLTKPIKRKALSHIMKKWNVPIKKNVEKEGQDTNNKNLQEKDDSGSSDGEIINVEIFNSMRDLMKEKFEKFIGITIDDMERLIVNIAIGINNADATMITEAAHSLKSVSAQLGILGLSEQAREVEVMGNEKQLDGMEERYKNIKSEYKKILSEIKKLM